MNKPHNPTAPLIVATLLNIQVNGLQVWSKLSLNLARQPIQWFEYFEQLFTLTTFRMLNLVPDWFLQLFLAAVQFPFGPSIGSALASAILTCLFPTILGPYLNGIVSVYQLYNWYCSSTLLIFSAIGLGVMAYYAMQNSSGNEHQVDMNVHKPANNEPHQQITAKAKVTQNQSADKQALDQNKVVKKDKDHANQ